MIESTLHFASAHLEMHKLFLLYREFFGCFSDFFSSILAEDLYLEGMIAQALPEFQPLLRNSVADEL